MHSTYSCAAGFDDSARMRWRRHSLRRAVTRHGQLAVAALPFLRTCAAVRSNRVGAGPAMLARHGGALVNVDRTCVASEARYAPAGVSQHPVFTGGTIQARLRCAIVHVDTVSTTVSGLVPVKACTVVLAWPNMFACGKVIVTVVCLL